MNIGKTRAIMTTQEFYIKVVETIWTECSIKNNLYGLLGEDLVTFSKLFQVLDLVVNVYFRQLKGYIAF